MRELWIDAIVRQKTAVSVGAFFWNQSPRSEFALMRKTTPSANV
jgi:hypothetical protein